MGTLITDPLHPGVPLLEWAVAMRTMPGQEESGDLHVVQPFPGGALVGVVDGLGHGKEAAIAARLAVALLKDHAQQTLISLCLRCHEELRRTRGVVLSLASFDARQWMMSWIGVGNVEAVLFRADREARPARESILLRAGVVGYQLPPLRAVDVPVTPGDTLVFATDGIRSDFLALAPLDARPQHFADRICTHYNKATDDALVLVARYLGNRP